MIDPYLTLLILASGFYLAWTIGANDVANAMGTSVGSGALTLRQAILIAAILEFSGAFFFGAHVTETLQTGIIDTGALSIAPKDFILGMIAILLGSGLWLQTATLFGWPVSTTHSIVGGIVGFGLILGGMEAIYWGDVALIGISWIISPLCGGLISFILFSFLKRKILYAPHPIEALRSWLPAIVAVVVFVIMSILATEFELFYALTFSILSALITRLYAARIQHPAQREISEQEFTMIESVFGYLQIVSASLMAFSHGANDVANAIGPLSAAFSVLQTNQIETHSSISLWMLSLGGIGIVVGLSTWGWRVIATIGKKLTELTPTRGFSAEFGAALTILVASRLGMPISTTHTLVGAVIGVGLARGIGALNLAVVRNILVSWMITIPAGALFSCALFFFLKWLF